MLELVKMPDDAFSGWASRLWSSYRDDLLRSGMSEEEADANIEHNRTTTMPNGVLAAGQFILDVLEDGAHVGCVWLAERGSDWFVYDFEIDEAHRGKGLGRRTMTLVEEWIRARGGTAIGLSVFGFNEAARRLYAASGFEVVQLSMKKKLS